MQCFMLDSRQRQPQRKRQSQGFKKKVSKRSEEMRRIWRPSATSPSQTTRARTENDQNSQVRKPRINSWKHFVYSFESVSSLLLLIICTVYFIWPTIYFFIFSLVTCYLFFNVFSCLVLHTYMFRFLCVLLCLPITLNLSPLYLLALLCPFHLHFLWLPQYFTPSLLHSFAPWLLFLLTLFLRNSSYFWTLLLLTSLTFWSCSHLIVFRQPSIETCSTFDASVPKCLLNFLFSQCTFFRTASLALKP